MLGFWRERGGMNWWVVGRPGSMGGESGASGVWRMSGGEWWLVMETAACEQVMLLVMVRGLQWGEAVAAVALALVIVPCGGVPVAVGVGWGCCGEGAVGCTWLVPFGLGSVRLPLHTCGRPCAGG